MNHENLMAIFSGSCWKILLGIISPKTRITGTVMSTEDELPLNGAEDVDEY